MICRIVVLVFARSTSSIKSAKEGAVRTFVGLMLIVGASLAIGLSGSGPIDAVAEQAIMAQAGQAIEPPMPIYTPPKKFSPRARVGGELRGTEGTDPEIQAIVPDHVALTVKKTPALNWFLSKPTKYEIRFTLVDNRVIKPVHEGPIASPKEAGIYTIDLKQMGLILEPDVQYRWYVSAIRDPKSNAQDIVAGGVIERCEFSECLIENPPDLTCSQESVLFNAKNGFWYDAMSCLCSLIDAKPRDASLRRQRASLLRQVGLHKVAEWDLQSISR
jgi:uncharacterized protein DUF928